MVKAYMLYYLSSAYDSRVSGTVICENWNEAIRLLLNNEKEKNKDHFSYHILDNTEIYINLNENDITFSFREDSYRDFFTEFRNEARYSWSYLEFKDHIQELKEFLVYEKDAGDDAFCSWELRFLEFDVDPTVKQCMKCIGWDDGSYNWEIVSIEEKKEPEEIYDENRVGGLYYEDLNHIEVN